MIPKPRGVDVHSTSIITLPSRSTSTLRTAAHNGMRPSLYPPQPSTQSPTHRRGACLQSNVKSNISPSISMTFTISALGLSTISFSNLPATAGSDDRQVNRADKHHVKKENWRAKAKKRSVTFGCVLRQTLLVCYIYLAVHDCHCPTGRGHGEFLQRRACVREMRTVLFRALP